MIKVTADLWSNGALFLSAVCFLLFILSRVEIRRVTRNINHIQDGTRRLFGLRVGSYLCIVIFLVSLLPWVSLIVASRFNWSSNDVSEIEIAEFTSPYPQVIPERTFSIKDTEVLSSLFHALEVIEPYNSGGHEHAVGKSYILKLRRKSDGSWSDYRVELYPDKETTGSGVHMAGVYEMRVSIGSGKLNMGSFQAIKLGRIVEELAGAEERSATTHRGNDAGNP